MRRRRWLAWLALAIVCVGAAWISRESLLNALGRLPVEQDPPQQVDLGAIVASDPVPAAEEMADLVTRGYVPRVIIISRRRPTDAVLDRLRISASPPAELAALVLARLGVPAGIVSIESIAGDEGTNTEIRALTRYMRRRNLRRVLVIADRSHSRRVAMLLRSWLGATGSVVVRAPLSDPFAPERWWHSRESSRELVMEALRWINSFAFGDWWRDLGRNLESRPQEGKARESFWPPSAIVA